MIFLPSKIQSTSHQSPSMQNSKLIQYLSALPPQELQQFSDFVASPFFNKHENTKRLLAHILKVKNWQSPRLGKEKIYQQLFPNKPFDDQLLSNVISYLLRLLRRFLMQKQWEEEETAQQLILLEKAFHLKQEKLFELTAGRLARNFKKTNLRDHQFFFQKSRFHHLQDDFNLNFQNRSSGEFLEQAIDNFDYYFIGEKLKMTCQMLARKQVTGRDFTFSLVDVLIQFLEKKADKFRPIPSIWMYYLIYKMMTENAATFYFELKGRLKDVVALFKQEEGRDLYTHAINFCVGRINVGEEKFRQETFELYQQMLDNKLLFVDGVLRHWGYTNIVSLGCYLKEFEWTKSFILEQKERLPKSEKENAFTYNLAAFYYSQQQYDAALEQLREVEFTEVYYDLVTRILLLKIYFETKNWQVLEYNLETFRIYLLRNKKLTESRRKSGRNFLLFTKKIMLLLESQPILGRKDFEKQRTALKLGIEKVDLVLSRSWLLECLI